MEFNYILGVDMSKEWFDYCLMDRTFTILFEDRVDNNPKTISEFVAQFEQRLFNIDESLNSVILVVEHTGIYTQHLSRSWLGRGGRMSLVDGSKINQSLDGKVKRPEKTDFLDARRIAGYGVRFSDQLRLWQAKAEAIEALRGYQRLRERMLRVLNVLKVPLEESKQFDNPELSEQLGAFQSNTFKTLREGIKQLEDAMDMIISEDKGLKALFKLITSVTGVGPVTGREILIATEGFTRFTPDQAKSFARYSGVVPLPNESGKSTKRRPRTSKQSNKHLKKLLTLGAWSLIKTKTELGRYYERKREEGKPYYSVINAMRNKLILRVFAVVRNNSMYEKNLNYSLVKP